MKSKVKYSIGLTISLTICVYSAIHQEKYDVLIPIIFGALSIFSLAELVVSKK